MIKKLKNTFHDGMMTIDPKQIESNVDLRPFRFEHTLCDHPLFQLESLVELSKRLPKEQREYLFAKQEFGTHEDAEQYKHAADNDELSTEDLIQSIEHQNFLIVLRNVETDSVYGQFVNDCLDSLSDKLEPVTGPVSQRESFIFISPPRAYTPYHYDPEQNLFMQIRGKKQMAVYDVTDRNILPEQALEEYYGNNQKITKCDEALFDQCNVHDLNPGQGVYVPVTAPHWVRTLDEISISVSINFRSPSSIRRARVFRFNRWMRSFGLNPSPVSDQASSMVDLTKSGLLGVPARIRKMMKS